MSTLYYYEPFFSFNDINRLFDDSRRVEGTNNHAVEAVTGKGFRPNTDVHENSGANLITATFELPGLNKEDVSIDVHNNRLIVSGETKFSKDTEENGYIVKERPRGRFSRALPLPAGTKPEEIKASMENGVLTVSFPKSSPKQAAKKISIA